MTELEKEAIETLLKMSFWAYLLDVHQRDAIPKEAIAEIEHSLQQQTATFPVKEIQSLLKYLRGFLALHYQYLDERKLTEQTNSSDIIKMIADFFTAFTGKEQGHMPSDILACFAHPVDFQTRSTTQASRTRWQGEEWLAHRAEWSLHAFIQQNEQQTDEHHPKQTRAQQLVAILDVLHLLEAKMQEVQSQKSPVAKDSLFLQHQSFMTHNELLARDIDAALSKYRADIQKVLNKLNQVGYLKPNLEAVTRIHVAIEMTLANFVERRQTLATIFNPLEKLIYAEPFSLENTLEFVANIRTQIEQGLLSWQTRFVLISPKTWQSEPETIKTELDSKWEKLQEHLNALQHRMGQYEVTNLETRKLFEQFCEAIFAEKPRQTAGFEAKELFKKRDFTTLNAHGSYRWRTMSNYLICLSDILCMLKPCQELTEMLASASIQIQAWYDKRQTIQKLYEDLGKKIEKPALTVAETPKVLDKLQGLFKPKAPSEENTLEYRPLLEQLNRYINAFDNHKKLQPILESAQKAIGELESFWSSTKATCIPEHALSRFEPSCGTLLESLADGLRALEEQENRLKQVNIQLGDIERRAKMLGRSYCVIASQAIDEVCLWQGYVEDLLSVKNVLQLHARDATALIENSQHFVTNIRLNISNVAPADIPVRQNLVENLSVINSAPTVSLFQLQTDCNTQKEALSKRFTELKEHLCSGLELCMSGIVQAAPILPSNIATLPLENVFALPLKDVSQRFAACQEVFSKKLQDFRNANPHNGTIRNNIKFMESYIQSAQYALVELSQTWKKYQIMEKRLAFGPYQQLLAIRKILADEIARLSAKSNANDARIPELQRLALKFGDNFTDDFLGVKALSAELPNEVEQKEALKQFTDKLSNTIIESFKAETLKNFSAQVQSKLLQIIRAILAYLPGRTSIRDPELGKTAPFATISEITLFHTAKSAITRLREESYEDIHTVGVR